MRVSSLDKNVSLVGTWTGILGAVLIALNIGIGMIGYIIFVVSSIAWIVYGHRTRQDSLLMLNVTFLVVNLVGVYRFGLN